jgi:UDP-N-acetylglucosamine 2-epimerase (non-hydrolysing)
VIYLVAGARPNFMKIAPIAKAMRKRDMTYKIVHTGQHYDAEMSGTFFQDLDLPVSDVHLGVGSGTHARQTGKVMAAFEKVCFRERPGLVVVVGDVNSTLACALVAAKLCIPVAHVEAGLRSYDRTMPEEINRVLTDRISDYLFTTCQDANANLEREGIPAEKIHFVGNVMIDSLLEHRKMAARSLIRERLGLEKNGRPLDYAVLTLHRPSNVDVPGNLHNLLGGLNRIHRKMPVVFPAHPRTVKQLKRHDLMSQVSFFEDVAEIEPEASHPHILTIPPLGYLDFLALMSGACLVLTDSGGIQEETTILGIPCLTLRHNTERPITVEEGTNKLVGTDPDLIVREAKAAAAQGKKRKKMPKFWDGKAADRIVNILFSRYASQKHNKLIGVVD